MNAKETRARTARETATLLRRCLAALAAICAVVTTIELMMLRHWGSFERTIPFYAMGALAGCIIAFVARPTPRTIQIVRIVLGLVALTAIFGLYEHIHENYIAGP